MLFEHPDRVEIGRRAERVTEDLDAADPVYPEGPSRIRGTRTAEQVPTAVADDHRPWLNVDEPFGSGLGAISKPNPASIRARLDEGGGDPGIGSRGGAVRRRSCGLADGLGLRRNGLR